MKQPPADRMPLTFDATLAVLLGLIGQPVEVTVGHVSEQVIVAGFSGTLTRGESVPADPGAHDDGELVYFSMAESSDHGFYVSERYFQGAEWLDRNPPELLIALSSLTLLVTRRSFKPDALPARRRRRGGHPPGEG